jgi:hypothetical protein
MPVNKLKNSVHALMGGETAVAQLAAFPLRLIADKNATRNFMVAEHTGHTTSAIFVAIGCVANLLSVLPTSLASLMVSYSEHSVSGSEYVSVHTPS